MTAVVMAIKEMKPTRAKAPNLRMGAAQDEARPSHATRSSSISNDAVPSFSTRSSIPASGRSRWVRDHAREHAPAFRAPLVSDGAGFAGRFVSTLPLVARRHFSFSRSGLARLRTRGRFRRRSGSALLAALRYDLPTAD